MPSAREREDSATEMKTAIFQLSNDAVKARRHVRRSLNAIDTRVRGEGDRTDAALKYGKDATVR